MENYLLINNLLFLYNYLTTPFNNKILYLEVNNIFN